MKSTNNSSTSNMFLKSRILSIKDHRSLMSKSRKDKGLKNAPISIFFEDDKKFKIVLLDHTTKETIIGLKKRVLYEIDTDNKHSALRTRAYNVVFSDDNVFPDTETGELKNDAFLDENTSEYFMVPINPASNRANDSGNLGTSPCDVYNTNVRFDGIEYKQKNFSDRLLSDTLRGAIFIKHQKNIKPTIKFFNFFIDQNGTDPVDPTQKLSYYFKSLQVQDDKELYERGVLNIRIEFRGIVELGLVFPNKKKMLVEINPLYSLARLINTFHKSIGSNYDLYIGESETPLSLEQHIWQLESDELIVKHKVEKMTGFGDMDEAERLLEKNETEDNEEMNYNVKFKNNRGSLREGKFTYKNKLFYLMENKKSLVFNIKKGGANQTFSGSDVAEITQNNCDDSFTIRIINNKGKIEIFDIFTEDIETKTKIIGKILLLK